MEEYTKHLPVLKSMLEQFDKSKILRRMYWGLIIVVLLGLILIFAPDLIRAIAPNGLL